MGGAGRAVRQRSGGRGVGVGGVSVRLAWPGDEGGSRRRWWPGVRSVRFSVGCVPPVVRRVRRCRRTVAIRVGAVVVAIGAGGVERGVGVAVVFGRGCGLGRSVARAVE